MPGLPAPSAHGHALAHLVMVLERREPGLADKWIESLEDEAAFVEMMRLRSPADRPALETANREARVWAGHIRALIFGKIGRVVLFKKKKR